MEWLFTTLFNNAVFDSRDLILSLVKLLI